MNWKDLAEEIGIPSAAVRAMDCPCPDEAAGLLQLKGLLTRCLDTREEYARLGIPDSVFLDSCRDFPIWCRDYLAKHSVPGVSELGWLSLTVEGKLFRLGRLQFEPQVLKTPMGGFPAGIPVLEVHIPAEAPLEPEAVLASLARAPEFFRRYFGREYALFHCHSWLLSPALRELLPEGSRILRFQDLFQVVLTDREERQAEERVFGYASDDFAAYPEGTSLQRAMKAFLLRGGSLSMGHGLREIP